jgi:circadian clock protein KaiC
LSVTQTKRVKTGCEGLDQILRGGLLEGSATLVEGSAGTGKTTLALQFIMQGVKEGQHGLIFTFEQFPEQYYDCAAELGWDLRALQKQGKLDVIFTSPEAFLEELEEGEGRISKLIAEKSTKRVAVDSMTHFERLAPGDIGQLRAIETEVVNAFKREECTALLLKENANILGKWDVSSNKIPFIVDTYILLRYLELQSEIKRCLMILKMRGSDHDKDIVEYRIENGGLQLGAKFSGVSGIFLGTGITSAPSKR